MKCFPADNRPVDLWCLPDVGHIAAIREAPERTNDA
jgi:hypothetical protein